MYALTHEEFQEKINTLFYSIDKGDIFTQKEIYGNLSQVISDNYKAITRWTEDKPESKLEFLAIRKAKDEELITHQTAYECFLKVKEKFRQQDSTLEMNHLSSPEQPYYIFEEKSWVLSFAPLPMRLENLQFDTIKKHFEDDKNFHPYFDDTKSIDSEALKKYTPYIAFENGYDIEDKLVLYILVVRNIPQSYFKNLNKVSLLCLDRFDVKYSKILNNELVDDIYQKFATTITRFSVHYNYLSNAPTSEEKLIALTLDLLNLNRDLDTLQIDSKHISIIGNAIKKAKTFYKSLSMSDTKGSTSPIIGNGLNYAHLIDYLIDQNISLDMKFKYRKEIQEVVVKKKFYEHLTNRIISPTLVNKRFVSYESGQVKVLENLTKLLNINIK